MFLKGQFRRHRSQFRHRHCKWLPTIFTCAFLLALAARGQDQLHVSGSKAPSNTSSRAPSGSPSKSLSNTLGKAPSTTPGNAPTKLSFNQSIAPILSENCYPCHGPDPGARKAKLRLDRAEFAYAPHDKSGPAIVPGQTSKSPLLQKIESKNPKDRMPPPEAHKTLTSQQIASLREWIRQGAVYEEHWSFIVPKSATDSRSNKKRLGAKSDRQLHFGSLGKRRAKSVTASRQAIADSARNVRLDRFAANSRRSGSVRSRQFSRRV